MNLELLTTIASLTTALIVGATAVAAIVQLRHMRSSNQINAQLAVRTLINEVRKEGDLLRKPAATETCGKAGSTSQRERCSGGSARHEAYPKGVPRMNPSNPWAGEALEVQPPELRS